MSDEAFDASLDLLRRLNPKHIVENLNALCKIQPSLAEDLLSAVDKPLGVSTCSTTGKLYLTCDYNRDGDCYRSPWSNKYEPNPVDDEGPLPSEALRKLEIAANESFDIYRDMYYEGGVSSVYLWDQEDMSASSFAGVVLLKKKTQSSWDAIHVFEVEATSAKQANYKITSTIILDVVAEKSDSLALDLSGYITRQLEKTLPLDDYASHISNIGSLVEEIESKLRNILNDVYFGKTRDILGDLRSTVPLQEIAKERKLQGEVAQSLGR